MAQPDTGMDKQTMQRLLAKSKKEPVNFATAQGDGGMALLMLDLHKQGKAVEQMLIKQFPSAKNPRFGSAVVDTEQDAKLVKFFVNKPVSGLGRKLVKTLKGTGFSKVQILLEDGTAVELSAEDEDPAAGAAPTEADASAAAPPVSNGVESAAADPPAADPGAADPGALAQTLAKLKARISAADPSQQAALTALVAQGAKCLQARDTAGASDAIKQLQAALNQPNAAPSQAQAGPDAQTAARYAKASQAWHATRQKLERDIGTLEEKFTAAFAGHEMADKLVAAFQTRVEPVLVKFDTELADKLAAASSAADPAQHATLVADARQALQRYQGFVASDATLAELDRNPFVPLAIQKSLTATLSVLAKTIA